MSGGQYAAGVLLLAATLVPLTVGAVAVRGWALPGWRGAPARLAEAIAAVGALLVVAELLGTVGALRRGWLAGACALVGAGAVIAARRARPPAAEPLPDAPPVGPLGIAAAAVAVALVAWEWAARSVEVLYRGMADPDTLWYHMPFAARFAHEGWTTRLPYMQPEPITTFHPAASELLHGIGLSIFGGYDVMSPFVNLAFAGLALLGGWCVGRRHGVAPASMIGVAVVLVTPIMLQTQPGEAANDAVGLAFLVAAAGLLMSRAPLGFAGLAAGLALGSKLSLLAPVGLLTLGVVFAARRARPAAAATWVAAVIAGGGFWYLRNLFRVGNPLPWYGVHLGPIDLPSPPLPQTNAYSSSVAHYIGDGAIWRDTFLPGLHSSLGDLWPAIVLLAAAGALLTLARGPTRIERALGATAFVAGLAYLITPAGAGGPPGFPVLFGLNLRFATPPLALGLALLPVVLPRRRTATAAAMLVLLLVTQAYSGFRPAVGAGWGLVIAAGLVAAGALALRSATRMRIALGVALALLVVAVGWPVQRSYLDDRYADRGPTLPEPSLWAQHLHGQRIGVAGYLLQYPLYGRDTSNRVDYLGVHGPHGGFSKIADCPTWRRTVDRGRYRYVVTAPTGSVVLGHSAQTGISNEELWTRGAPGAVEIVHDGVSAVFRIDRPLDPAGCPREGGRRPASVSGRG